MSPKLLILGKDGQVGWELQRALAPLGPVLALGRGEADLAVAGQAAARIRAERPAVVINAAAYTAVDKAESEPLLARRINGEALAEIGEAAREVGALVVHYSTDYVFAGTGTHYQGEDEPVAPASAYGASKLLGEVALAESGAAHLIFRTCWVFGRRGGNFAKTMLKLARDRAQLRVIADQIGAPTGAALIADVTAHAVRTWWQQPEARARLEGLYHLAAAGETSWHGYATHVIGLGRQLGMPLLASPENVQPIATQDYPLPAPRPGNSRLATGKLEAAFGLRLPPWQKGVSRLVQELAEPPFLAPAA